MGTASYFWSDTLAAVDTVTEVVNTDITTAGTQWWDTTTTILMPGEAVVPRTNTFETFNWGRYLERALREQYQLEPEVEEPLPPMVTKRSIRLR